MAVYSAGPGETNSGYLKHRDAFRVDPNNLVDNQRLRKLTLISYLNSEFDPNCEQKGCLRLYLQNGQRVDIVPRKGRIIIFASDVLEHSVQPLQNPSSAGTLNRFALTIWFQHIVKKPALTETKALTAPKQNLIFAAIPCYRDPELIPTLRSLITSSADPGKLRIGIYLQIDLEQDLAIATDLQQIVLKNRDVKFRILQVDASEAKNAYYARH